MSKCDYCKRDMPDGLACWNTRYMEDMAIFGDDEICYQQLVKLGGGEKGQYVDLNREYERNRRAAP